ncbi:MAG: hypothetical protein KN64_00970 [Sulfurovum sp. AS07-7]|nr:MAG: hypothetical protein KN64_00970 [Sulfurovum sp. AS07-7]
MLSKNIIDKQTEKLASEYFAELYNGKEADKNRSLSRAFTQLAMKQILEIDEGEAYECVVDSKNDFAIDGIYFTEPQNEFFDIYIFQSKYVSNLEKNSGVGETEIIKMIESLKKFFSLTTYDINDKLHQKLIEINSIIADFNIPNFHIYFANNGQAWSQNTQKIIDDFLNESIENKKRFEFNYINHDTIFSIFEKSKPVDCFLNFSGKIVDEAINFKRSFIGKVSIANIHSLMQEHGAKILKQNVRDFLGFSKAVNNAIKSTLLDETKRDDFFFLNNGITMVCEKIDYATGIDSVRAKITNAQIINGGQTSKTIQTVVEANPSIDFSNTFVLVRVYQIDMDNENAFVNAITTATNSQNAIYAKDLKANDKIQLKIEAGLKEYDIVYLRRRDDRRSGANNIRMDMAAEALLATIAKKPQDAKYRKALHFTEEFYGEIFDESKVTSEIVYFVTMMFKKIETKRKGTVSAEHKFIPFASHFILSLMYEHYINKKHTPSHKTIKDDIVWLNSAKFDESYTGSIELLQSKIEESGCDSSDITKIIEVLKSKNFAMKFRD